MILDDRRRKRKAHKSSAHFSINYKYRRNQMSLQYSQRIFDSHIDLLDRFIGQTTSSISITSFGSLNADPAPQNQLLTSQEAKITLRRLIERVRAGGQRKNWKVEETNYLLFIVDRYCQARRVKSEQLASIDWQRISQLVPHRNGSACQFRFLSLKPASISSVPWTSQEGQLLHRIIQNQKGGTPNWRKISQQLYQLSEEKKFRTGKQCREHYSCFLKPHLKKGAWTDEEDYLLITLFLRIGRRWSKIAKVIEGRNQNAIKNRFFLMFQNRKDTKLSSPDLLKMVRRRRQKLERKILPQEQKSTQEHAIVANGDSSSLQLSSAREPDLATMPSTIVSDIFIDSVEPAVKIEESQQQLFVHEEFQKYIDL